MPEPPYYLWNYWYLAGRSRSVRKGKLHAVTVMETRIALFRDSRGEVVALRDRCPHLGASLSLGKVANDCVSCPFHGWTFARDGRCVDIPALGEPVETLGNLRIPHFPTAEAFGLIWIYMAQDGAPPREPAPLPPELLAGGWAGGLIEDLWPTNYTRFAENMLDMLHLPYVHARTIGRFSRSRGPIAPRVTPQPDGFDLEDGRLSFRLPNVHRLVISDKLLTYMWGVPVGPTETRVYVLGLRRFARAPWLNPFFDAFNRRILEEDRSIIASQEPKHVTFGPGGDMLLGPDTAARAYRQLLRERLDGAAPGA